jgi:hypothetical protein
VVRGAAHLDGLSTDWFARALLTSWPTLCVYLNERAQEDPSGYTAVALGFLADERAEIEPLFAEWRRVIAERRAAS